MSDALIVGITGSVRRWASEVPLPQAEQQRIDRLVASCTEALSVITTTVTLPL